MTTSEYTSKIISRFWSKVNKNGSVPTHCPELGQCWEWTVSKNTGNYGQFYINKKLIGAHRISWELANGEIPDDLWVLHKCDNRGCCNPDHLFLGTQQDNTDDMMNKGRRLGKTGKYKLTRRQRINIQNEYSRGNATYKELSKKYHVTEGYIGSIVRIGRIKPRL